MIKVRPEDFVVEERASLRTLDAGEYRLYLLTKSGWTTPDAVRRLARTCGVSPAAIAYGGKKDKHGLTRQFITIRDGRDFSGEDKAFRIEARGFLDRPMGPDLILGNDFRITIRDLAEPARVEAALGSVRAAGVPNFFDDQRFRSYDPERGFFAEKILRGHYNGAIQVYATSTTPEMKAAERERRRALFKAWRDWPACLEIAAGREERKIFADLIANGENFAKTLHLLAPEEVSMRYSAFQSHLWNELLRRVVRNVIAEPVAVAGAAGDYLFWPETDDAKAAVLGMMTLPTAAAHMEFGDENIRALFDEILGENGLRRSDFRTRVLRKVYFKSVPRPAAVVPENLAVLESGPDELNRVKKKITISFALPRGAYATIIVKRLTLNS